MFSLSELKDKNLGCWCAPSPCHGDVLIKLFKEVCGENSVTENQVVENSVTDKTAAEKSATEKKEENELKKYKYVSFHILNHFYIIY